MMILSVPVSTTNCKYYDNFITKYNDIFSAPHEPNIMVTIVNIILWHPWHYDTFTHNTMSLCHSIYCYFVPLQLFTSQILLLPLSPWYYDIRQKTMTLSHTILCHYVITFIVTMFVIPSVHMFSSFSLWPCPRENCADRCEGHDQEEGYKKNLTGGGIPQSP